TRLPFDPGLPTFPATAAPAFASDDVIVFPSLTNPDGLNPRHEVTVFSVKTDGSNLRVNPISADLEGSQLLPRFSITGRGRIAATLPTADAAEVFLFDGTNVLQLTSLHRPDTGILAFAGVDGTRVFFSASADPFAVNPSHNCQLFSVDSLGNDLRQLTRFS